MTTVVVFSESLLYREGLRLILERDGRILVQGTASNAAELREALATVPEVMLVDIASPRSLALASSGLGVSPRTRMVVVTPDESEELVVACAKAGADGYVTRDATVDDLVDAIHAATRAELRCSPRVAGYLLRRLRTGHEDPPSGSPHALTSREREVARLLADGFSNKEIACRLHIAVPTVKNHVHRILEKLNVERRAQAALLLRSHTNGLVA